MDQIKQITKKRKMNFRRSCSWCTDKLRAILTFGNLKAKVGNVTVSSKFVMGKFGKVTKSANGEILIEFCIQNELVIMNICFQHKDIHHKFEKIRDVTKNLS